MVWLAYVVKGNLPQILSKFKSLGVMFADLNMCLIFQSVYGQYWGGLGGCGCGAGWGGRGFGYGAGWDGFDAGCGGEYGGTGIGNVAVFGELPVAGVTAVSGRVPIIGAVEFGGPACAGGAVSICGHCAPVCGCGRGIY